MFAFVVLTFQLAIFSFAFVVVESQVTLRKNPEVPKSGLGGSGPAMAGEEFSGGPLKSAGVFHGPKAIGAPSPTPGLPGELLWKPQMAPHRPPPAPPFICDIFQAVALPFALYRPVRGKS